METSKKSARTARRLIRTLKKSKYTQARASRKYKHGWEVPRDYAHALQLDIQNGNNKWNEAIDLEIEQIKEYQVFKDFGKAVYEKNKITNAPEGHQKIRVHSVFDVKHCGKFKARLVADGHLTKEPMETVYSGVVSIRNLRLAMFLAELNNLELWGADVGNAYLQALTRENFTLWVDLNLRNLSCTKLFMVQDQEEHVGMRNSLIYSMIWVSNPQKQIQTYG